MPVTAPAARVRTRTGATAGAKGPASNVRAVLEPLAATFYTENRIKNEHDRMAQSARKKLRAHMSELLEDKPFSFVLQTDDGPLTLNVTVDTPQKEVIDPRALYKLMECDRNPKALEEFFDMCSVTVKAVEEHKGKVTASRVRRTVLGEPAVNVKPAE